MARSTDDQEKRLAELKKEVTRRDFDRHASVLKDISELPIELQSPAVTALAQHEAIQTIIAFPPQIQRGWHYVPKQALLFTGGGMIHLLASIWTGREPAVTYLEGCGLLYAKVTLLLLYGFLEIVAQGPEAPTCLGMEFNTVDWYCLSPPLRRFLQMVVPDGFIDKSPCSHATQQTLNELPLKFLNGVRIYGILPGQKLKELVFQPGTWKRWLYFLRQPILADTLLLLTTNYMVVIQEELGVKQGWILSYIPRRNIDGMQNRPSGLWNELSVQLKHGDQSIDYKLRLESKIIEIWRKQWAQHGGLWEDFPAQ